MSLLGVLSCVTFSPTDLSLVKGPPLGRRRFFDRHVADNEPTTVKAYIDYQRALRQKNALLKSSSDPNQLIPWNQIIAPAAAVIINSRMKLLREIESRLSEVSQKLFDDSSAIALKVRGPSAHLIESKAQAEVTTEEVLTQLESVRLKESEKRSTTVGPHRDDVVPFLFGKDARAFASQGQSRSIVLALKLAVIELIEARRGDTPVVLLDDVDSELDEMRRHAIFDAIFSRPRQVIITSTEYRLPETLSGKVGAIFSVEAGELGEKE